MRKMQFGIAGVVVIGAVVAGIYFGGLDFLRKGDDSNVPLTTVRSADLARTDIVPTLDSPLPAGKNVIWCASFQLAWNELRDSLAKGPVKADGAAQAIERLNSSPVSKKDVGFNPHFAAAGLVKDGAVERVSQAMEEQFGRRPSFPISPSSSNGVLAYAYMQARAKFEVPFFDRNSPLEFTDSRGKKTPVSSFGIHKEHEYAYHKLREQIRILYYPEDRRTRSPEFVVDPCRTSSPNQLLLAKVSPGKTLADTIARVEELVEKGHEDSEFGVSETFAVPNMNFEVAHEFAELKGVSLLNDGLLGQSIEGAFQDIRFRLDRSGAELESEAKVLMMPIPRHFIFDGPFLVIMKERNARHPFFVMWVDNSELLSR